MERIQKRNELTQSQKLMVFTLSMSLYGLSSLAEELLPALSLGPLVLSAKYFAFVPIALCMLFNPLYTAVGAATGALLFGGILAGQFGGFGELEQFIALSLGLFVAGSLVKDPKNRKQIAVAALAGAIIHHGIGSAADVQQVMLGAGELQTVPGLAGLLILAEIASFISAILVSGLLFGLLPVLILVPLLHGKIEPALGMDVRGQVANLSTANEKARDVRFMAAAILLVGIAFISDYLYEAGLNLEWQANFAEAFGNWVLWLNLIAAALVAGMTMTLMAKHKRRSLTAHYHEDRFIQ
ncbi:cell division protein FtsQ [Planomicrobium sp. CPCC 101079]|uniref:cell division protein FtsQ n=1 Tax=Planomicrobium sp. CPCC 101079 TaxID=2599618 RepID=UPI0011B4EC83|nr:cell division protein FtsQ [Planomicrobium sp. CPCC 101079]TWT00497.1 cell division protein FtsQ [Planomicrobium sp. CPCC 101079]